MSMQLIWKHVSNEWFYTKSALFVFSTSAAIVMLSLTFGWGLEFLPKSVEHSVMNAFSNPSPMAQVGFTLAGVSVAAGHIVIFVGMFRFWAVCDRSRPIARRIWFVIMIVGVLVGLSLGTALYCFMVYLPQMLKNSVKQSQRIEA
ncbi:MAG TPA: hypothetical protein VJO53_13905 [Candidatus Acidoferrales bacterium]|nr:hypothetical protein [Candidatus Acidoferrales bacterium]